MQGISIKQNRIHKFNLSSEDYQKMYQASLSQPDIFFADLASRFIDWFSPWETVVKGDFNHHPIQWFPNATLNLSYNCLDRHLPKFASKTALIWEGNEPGHIRRFTYQELFDEVCLMANVLKKLKVCRNDVVCIYMPMSPEAIVAMLACARIGAIHNVVFGGFSSQALATRIQASQAKLLITANYAYRGNKPLAFKEIADQAVQDSPSIEKILVIQHEDQDTHLNPSRDHWYHELKAELTTHCPAEAMKSQDPLFILYTSGSTGKPKGIVHSQGGYAVYVAASYYYLFNHQIDSIHWSTADIGWITGHSYGVYGPLLNGATCFIYESLPSYPDYSRIPSLIEKHKINHFYTAPTLLRLLRHHTPNLDDTFDLSSLHILGSVGEPINPEVWLWYFNTFGNASCPIINTWWQTETGGILFSPLPCDNIFIPGGAGKPFFGIEPLVDTDSSLYIKKPWPSLMQTIYHDQSRFISAYFNNPNQGYLSGDGAYYDENQELHISGRLDDVIKISGHRFGSEEMESALISHPAVTEAAVIGINHELTGESMMAFLVASKERTMNAHLSQELCSHLKKVIGPIAQLEKIIWVNDLPKTRSGKIMRRILKKISHQEFDDFGDLSSLSDPNVLQQIIKSFQDQNSKV
jgi:acetyl-CoA synthetase